MTTSWRASYRPDIDGNRTLAIGSVFPFHLGVDRVRALVQPYLARQF